MESPNERKLQIKKETPSPERECPFIFPTNTGNANIRVSFCGRKSLVISPSAVSI